MEIYFCPEILTPCKVSYGPRKEVCFYSSPRSVIIVTDTASFLHFYFSLGQSWWNTMTWWLDLTHVEIFIGPEKRKVFFFFIVLHLHSANQSRKLDKSQRDMMIPTTMLRDDDIYDLPAIMPKDDETWWYCSNAAGWLDLELVMTIKVYLFKFWGISAYIIEL